MGEGASGDEDVPAVEAARRARARYGVDYPLDVQRWFQHSDCGGRDYLIGNPHTFRGRIAAYCPHEDVGFTVSKQDIDVLSPSAQAWLEGYLAGAEPEPQEVFGPDIHDVGVEDERWVRWQQLVRDFRASGTWLLQDWWDPAPLPAGVDLPALLAVPAVPWVVRGAEVWTWQQEGQERGWVRAQPQPALSRGFLVGSACERRDDHDEEVVAFSERQWMCRDCGHLIESR